MISTPIHTQMFPAAKRKVAGATAQCSARWLLTDLDEVLRAGSQVAPGSAHSLDVCCQNELRCQELAF